MLTSKGSCDDELLTQVQCSAVVTVFDQTCVCRGVFFWVAHSNWPSPAASHLELHTLPVGARLGRSPFPWGGDITALLLSVLAHF